MTDEQVQSPELQQLRAMAELREQPFVSDMPVFGGLITWFRSTWNNVSTTWYVRPILTQQSQFNQVMVQVLERFEAHDRERNRLTTALEQQIAYNKAALEQLQQLGVDNQSLQHLVDELGNRLIDQDREFTDLAHSVGESAARIVQLRESLQALESSSAPQDDPEA